MISADYLNIYIERCMLCRLRYIVKTSSPISIQYKYIIYLKNWSATNKKEHIYELLYIYLFIFLYFSLCLDHLFSSWSHYYGISFFILKQDIHRYIVYSRPKGWTEWATFFVNTHGWTLICYRLKTGSKKFFINI